MAFMLPYQLALRAGLAESWVKRNLEAAAPGFIYRAGDRLRLVKEDDADEVIRLLREYRAGQTPGRPRKAEAVA